MNSVPGFHLASSPGPLFIFVLRGPGVRKYVMLHHSDQRGCVHGDASFHHDIVPECLWPSSSLVLQPLKAKKKKKKNVTFSLQTVTSTTIAHWGFIESVSWVWSVWQPSLNRGLPFFCAGGIISRYTQRAMTEISGGRTIQIQDATSLHRVNHAIWHIHGSS